jgi:hypothetical protein
MREALADLNLPTTSIPPFDGMLHIIQTRRCDFQRVSANDVLSSLVYLHVWANIRAAFISAGYIFRCNALRRNPLRHTPWCLLMIRHAYS